MPYKNGKLKGELTISEIRKLISAHNKLTDIKIKKGSTRDDIIKLLKSNGYMVDHGKQSLIPTDRPRKKIITLTQAKEVTKQKPKTELQKQKSKEKKEEKEVQKKKEVREIKKKVIEEQKSIPMKKVISKPVSKITKDVGTQYSPPKLTPPPKPKPQDTKQAQKGDNRIDFYGKNGDKERLIVNDDKTFDTIKNLLDKEGYIMTEKQEYLLKEGTIEYVKEQKTPARINIKPAKGKTDMMIISIEGHSFGQGTSSIRIKKSVKPPPKKLTPKEKGIILLKSYNLPTYKDNDDFIDKIKTKKDGKKKMPSELTKKERDAIYEFQVKMVKELNKYQGKTDGKANFRPLRALTTTKQDTNGIGDFDVNFQVVVDYLEKYKPAKK
tara:strand:+ start:282 stop:1424 length:1143 start_codon:yes stop_codon:yes gene_type:complete